MATASIPMKPRPTNPWIVDSWRDLLLIVGAPLAVLAGISVAKLRWTSDQITTFALISAIGHHLPGMLRAYFDRELFARYRLRFIVAPLFLLSVCCAAFVWDLKGIILVAAVWGWWHYLAQAYGFMRIYDGKVGSVWATTRWLDKAMCVTWFAAPVILCHSGFPVFLDLFYKSGGPLVSAAWIAELRGLAVAVTSVVTLLFLVNLAYSYIAGAPPSAVKLLLMVSTFGYYWYSLATVGNVLVAYALFELFHDVQYLTIVWVFNQNRAARDPAAGGFTRFLFRKRGWLVVLYVILVYAYGSLNYGAHQIDNGLLRQILLGVFLASTLLHYYYDGFIWKLREGETRRTLGLQAIADGRTAAPTRGPRWLHVCAWAVFLVPVVLLADLQFRGMASLLDRWNSIATVAPDNAPVHFNLAVALEGNRDFDGAGREYRRALKIQPDYEKAHYNLAVLLARTGNSTEAIAHYTAAIRLHPRYASAYNNRGLLRMQQSNFSGAIDDFERARALDPGNPGFTLNLALARFQLGRQHEESNEPDKAATQYRQALQFKPTDRKLADEIRQALDRLNRATSSALRQ